MKINVNLQKSINKNVYYKFTLIELKYIKTYQITSINIIICNIFVQILY